MYIGTMLALVGVFHTFVGGVLYKTAWLEVLRDGVVASVPDFGDRATAMWFVITGLAVGLLGACVRDQEQNGAALPAPLAPGLLLLTLAIVVPMPVSGGWLFALIAGLAYRRRQAAAH